MKKQIIVITSIIIAGGGLFYGGMKYGQRASAQTGMNNFANLTPEERQMRFQQIGANANGSVRGARNGSSGGFIAGNVIAKDSSSITLKLRDGGSKIVFISGTTAITKSATGTVQDLNIGSEVTANGSANTDGSISAQSIQVRTMPVLNQ